MNALEAGYLCFSEISIDVNKLFSLLLFVYVVYFHPCSVVVACLPLNAFFILMLLQYCCSFVDRVNKSIVFIFGAFVYHFHFRNRIKLFQVC